MINVFCVSILGCSLDVLCVLTLCVRVCTCVCECVHASTRVSLCMQVRNDILQIFFLKG